MAQILRSISLIYFRTKKILDENPELKNKWVSLIPQGKMGDPEDLMGAVTFLLSDASGYVTGADLRGKSSSARKSFTDVLIFP